MKILITTIIIFTTNFSFGQKAERFPFQIIDAEGAYSKKGQVIKRFQFLSRTEKLELRNGNIHLVHYTGIPISFKGDTVINLTQLDKEISAATKAMSYYRPDLKRMFDVTPIVPGAIYDYNPLIVFPSPRIQQISHNERDDLCMRWLKGKSNKYLIEIKNIFDDSLKSYFCDSNSIIIPSNDLKVLQPVGDILLIFVKQDKRQEFLLKVRIIRNSNFEGLFNCIVNTADNALMIAYYMELAGKTDEAENYYKLAASLSSDKIFSEALGYFQKRKR
ncbi:hypothetical protein BH10BAC4_BH10BAC4_22150 [soil metagenome]